MGKGSGEQLDDGPEGHGVAQAHLHQQPEGLPDPVRVPGAVVVAGDGLGALGNALKGQHGKLHDAGKDGHGTYGDVAAVFQQGGIEAHGDHALAGLHDERCGAQSHAGQNQSGSQADIFLFQPQQRLRAGEEPQHPDAGNALGQNGGQGRAPDAHMQGKNEDGVQQDVGHRADEHRPHADLGKALGGDEAVEAQGHLDENGADGVDAHVIHGVGNGVLAGAEGQQQILAPQEKHRRQHSGDAHL